MELTEKQIQNYALYEIEEMLKRNGYTLADYEGMPVPERTVVEKGMNSLIAEELTYDVNEMKVEHDRLYPCLTDEQRNVYHSIMDAISSGNGGVFFIYGYGGMGKTFLWRTLCSAIRGRGEIVLPVASSGIASLLLPRGRTAHSRFGIPLQVDETSMCNKIYPGSDLAGLLMNTKLIIWDEAPMTNKFCFEALDRSLRDIVRRPDDSSSDKPFGGLVVVFGGDFRQILPVVPKGSRHDIVHASLCSSKKIWSSCTVLKLTKNMRLQVCFQTLYSLYI